MKKLTIGIVIGLLIGLSGNAFAAVGDIIEAKFSQFTFLVDGEEVELEADPLVYQGSTYLPVRVVANLVGKEVVYQADSRTIELNTPNDEEVGKMDTTGELSPEVEKAIEDSELRTKLEVLRRNLISAEEKLAEDTEIMEKSKAFRAEMYPQYEWEDDHPESQYQQYKRLLEADQAEIDRIKSEISALEAQLQE